MSERAKTKLVNPTTDKLWVVCGSCNHETWHRVKTRLEISDENETGDVHVFDTYGVIQCEGCGLASFCHESQCSEDEEYDEESEGMRPVIRRELYPGRLAGRRLLPDSYYLPVGVGAIYQESHGAYCNRYLIMTGFGIRAIVESVCKDKSIKGGNLEAKIDGLAKAGHITKDGATILHSLRFMGNQAAHEMKAHTEAEIDAAFNVVEHLLNGVYVIPRQASNLPKPKPKAQNVN